MSNLFDPAGVTPALATATDDGGDRRPVVTEKGGVVFADSRDVARVFEKDLKHVHEAIRALIGKEPKWGPANFRPNYINDLTGQSVGHFDMTRDGLSVLAMGFTCAKALKWKLLYIEAFNRMEQELRARAAVAVDYLDPKNILGFVSALQAEVAKRDVVIREQGERLEKLDPIEAADGSMCISTAAKTLGVNPVKKLFDFPQARRWIFKRPNSSDWVAHQDRIQAGHLEHADHLYRDSLGQERVRSRVMVTAKGLVKIAELLAQKPH